MADFRKWLFALAVVALLAGLTVPASAQTTTPTCSSQVATNNLVRSEGYTELVGDVVITCTGGTPTFVGAPVPQANITLSLSQTVTSKITAVTSGSTFLEALLIIDEPDSLANSGFSPPNAVPIYLLNCGAPNAPESSAANSAGPGVCEIIASGPYVGNSSPYTYSGAAGHPNVFQGRQGPSANTIVFQGVPLDPPGTATRILRFTNIRVNANNAGIAQANQTSTITMNIASAGNSTLQLNIQGQTVATVLQGLVQPSVAVYSNKSFAQCISQAKGLLTATTLPAFGASSSCGSSSCNGSANSTYASSGYGTPTVRFQEGFANSWKVKNIAYTLANGTYTGGAGGQSPYVYSSSSPILTDPAGYTGDINQNVPGVSYFTESGFENQVALNYATNPPPGFGTSPNYTVQGEYAFLDAAGTGIASAGVATQGTRLATSLGNIPNGLSLYVSPVIFLYRVGTSYGTATGPNVNAGNATGVMVLTATASDGSGVYSPPSGVTSTSSTQVLQAVTQTNGTALIVYEVLFCDPFSIEYADVPIVVSYSSALSSNPPIGLPAPNTIATFATGFAPFYSNSAAIVASATLPIPRFNFTGTPTTLFGIVKCSCNLLFPYVTQAAGYDTGIAIANTTMDPYGTTNQNGAIQFWFYGATATSTGTGAAPPTVCTNTTTPGSCTGTTTPVYAGTVMTFTLYNGSTQFGLPTGVGAGFTGYMIAQAQFQYCHGFAFIGGLGGGPAVNSSTNGLSEGYLALVLDGPGLGPRGSATGETLGQ